MRKIAILAVFALALAPHLARAGKVAAPAVTAQGSAPETPDKGPEKPREKPDVFYDPSLLPNSVRAMRDKILEAALSGDTEKLKIVIQSNEMPPAFRSARMPAIRSRR